MSRFRDEHPADADLLVADIGNTALTVGTVVGGEVTHAHSVPPAQADALGDVLVSLWGQLDASRPRRFVVGSVVPDTLVRLCKAAARYLDQTPLVVAEAISLPMPVAVAQPDRVGVDRVCCAAAAYETLGHACVVADFGTAVTIDLISDDGEFLGGTIAPGLGLAATALAEHTAALPIVELRVPDGPVGGDTEAAIRAGIVYGAVGLLREVTTRFAEKIGRWPTLIATGGDAELVADQAGIVDRVVPNLCLRGLALAYRLEAAPADDA